MHMHMHDLRFFAVKSRETWLSLNKELNKEKGANFTDLPQT